MDFAEAAESGGNWKGDKEEVCSGGSGGAEGGKRASPEAGDAGSTTEARPNETALVSVSERN